MANNSMTFTASMRLNTKEFQKGVKTIQKSINSLKNTFLGLSAALGAGLGLNQLVSNLKNTAVQLSVAKNTLENVSNATKEWEKGSLKGKVVINEYGKNIAFVKNLAKEYSQDMIALTQSFAKFHAACDQTNISMEQQKFIFEQLTRAAAYFHMSADQTRDMQNAIVQMASKGKVAAEELRRQLGNSLPGAFNLMAAALDVSTSKLDDMMRKGQVLAEDALPKFAAMLKIVTQNAKFDSLQLSMNALKNSWTELVEKMNMEGFLSKIVKGTDSGVKYITNNLSGLKSALIGVFSGTLLLKGFKSVTTRGGEYLAQMETQLEKLEKKRASFVSQMDKNPRLASFNDLAEINGLNVRQNPKYQAWTGNRNGSIAGLREATQKDIKLLENYYSTLRDIDNQYKMMGRKSPINLKNLDKAIFEFKKISGETDNIKKKVTGLQKLGAGFVSLGRNIAATFTAMLPAAIISAIIAGLSAIITKQVEIAKRWKEVRSIYDNYKKDVEKTDELTTNNIKELEMYLKVAQDVSIEEKKRVAALKKINELTGSKYGVDALNKTKKAYQDVNKEVKRFIESAKLQSKIQIQIAKNTAAGEEYEKLKERNRVLVANMKTYEAQKKEALKHGATIDSAILGTKYRNAEIEYKQNWVAMVDLQKVIRQSQAELDKLGYKWSETLMGGDTNGGDGGKVKGIQKVYQDYIEDLKELQNKLREKAITEEDYNKEFDKLVTKSWEDAAATGQLKLDDIIGKVDKGAALTKMEQWYYDLYVAAKKAAGKIAIKGVQDAIEKSIEEGIEEMGDAFEKVFEKNLEKNLRVSAANPKIPVKEKRNSLFDYSKSRSDILGEEAEASKDWYEALKDVNDEYKDLRGQSAELDAILDDILGKMVKAKNEAKTFENAMNIAKITEDIKEMQGELRKGIYGGIKDLASTMDRMVKGVESVKKAFEDTDTSGWEKFVAVFDLIANTIDGVMGIIETINTISKLTMSIDSAELALIEAKNKAYRDQISALMGIAAAKELVAQGNRSVISSELQSIAASKASTAASSKEAVAGATSSGAKLPFPWNLAAIALGVTTVLAALTSGTMKFAKGGIVGGNSFAGDKQLARVNSGEMILNRGQQSTLFGMLNGKGNSGGGEVQFKIRGCDLVGTLNNYNQRIKG